MNTRLIPLAALVGLLLLAGCNQQVLTLCPGAAVLADTASATGLSVPRGEMTSGRAARRAAPAG